MARLPQRKAVPPIVLTVARRMSRIESLLVELQFEFAKQSKRLTGLQVQLDAIADDAKAAADVSAGLRRTAAMRRLAPERGAD